MISGCNVVAAAAVVGREDVVAVGAVGMNTVTVAGEDDCWL